MARSLSLVLAFTFVVLLVGAGRVLLLPGRQPGPPAVQYVPQVRLADNAAGRTLPAPTSLPRGWRATSALVYPTGPVHLHIGFQTAGGGFVGLDEEITATARASRAFLAGELGSGTLSGPGTRTLVAGTAWISREGVGGEKSFSRESGGVTEVLVSTAGVAPLRTLAGLLR